MTCKIDVVGALRETLRDCSYAKRDKWCSTIGCRCQMAREAIPVAEAMAKVCEAADRYYYNRSQKTWSELCEALAALRKTEEGEKAGVVLCDDCGKYPADLPSKLCPGCEAYREHTGQI